MDWVTPAIGLLGGLFGGNKQQGPSDEEKAAQAAQANLINEQTQMAQLQKGLYTNVGRPGYMTALQGLLSSFGYRSPEQGVSGTSAGQPPKPWMQGFQPGGSFDYYAGYGQKLGQTANEYDKATQDITNRQDIDPTTKAALISQVNRDRAANEQNMAIQAQQAGPLAFLNALNPALNLGPAIQAASSGASSAGDLAGQYAQNRQWQAGQDQQGLNGIMNAISQITSGLYNKGGTGGVQTPTSSSVYSSTGGGTGGSYNGQSDFKDASTSTGFNFF